MTQNAESGAAAAKFGLETAALLGGVLGATKLKKNSNEFEYKGQRVTIRTGRKSTTDFGVRYDMLDRVQLVIAGFEVAASEYELWAISPETFKEHMRDSPTGKGRTGLVRKRVFTAHGKFVARVNIRKP